MTAASHLTATGPRTMREETVRTTPPRYSRQPRDAGSAAPGTPNAPGPADTEVPALIVKIGRYPLHHGGVAAIRTLGRLGVPVYAITEDSFTPAAVSRYCRGSFVWPTTGREDPAELVDGLMAIGAKIGRRTLAVPTDEEAAVLLAEHASRLSAHFLLPDVQPDLPRKLASKQGLYELCREHGVPAPASAFPATSAELAGFARQASFPLVAKNLEAWVRRRAPVVGGTTVLGSEQELLAAAEDWGPEPSVILQEYIPREHAQDWIVHLYCDAESNCLVEFTGIKLRSWPPHAGMTACARTVPNPGLAEAAVRFCKAIGFSGIADLDWRLDLRDGQYKLLDFNPRAGAQFRLFETEAGLDVVRAMHLDLTGRPVPVSPQVNGRKLIVENIDPLAQLAYRRRGAAPPAAGPTPAPSPAPGLPLASRVPAGQAAPSGDQDRAEQTELAWIAPDDPVPFLAMLLRLAGPALGHLSRVWRSRRVRRRAARVAHAATTARGQAPGPADLAGPAPASEVTSRAAGTAAGTALAAMAVSITEISAVAGLAIGPAMLAGQRKDDWS
jgi:D-aspartate ligase